MKPILYFCFFCLLLMVGGCKKDWLDVKTKQNLAVPSTFQDFQALLDNNSKINSNFLASISEIASDGHSATDAFLNTLANYQISAYTWSNIAPYTSSEYLTQYQAVYYSNLVLEGLDNITPANSTDQSTWNNLKGYALFLRGLSFYELSKQWAPAYDSGTAKTDLGISIRLSSNANIPQTRSSVQETYDQILGDLKTALPLLPNTALYKTRGSRLAAYAQLARVYLAIRDYRNAGLYADSSLQLSNSLLDYNTISNSTTPPFGAINLTNVEQIYIMTIDINSVIQSTNCIIDPALYASYAANDLRKQLFFGTNTDGSHYFIGMYNSSASINFGGLAVDEMYLIRAESYARAGNTSAAMADLNTLLKTRWKNTVPFPTYIASSADDALNQILTERKKELILRGLRWSDLRRLNKETRFATTLTRVYKGTTYTLAPNSYQYTFPIPDNVIQLSGIQQNPGW